MNTRQKTGSRVANASDKGSSRSLQRSAASMFELGHVCNLTVRALGPGNLGVVTLMDGSRIFVPNVGLGDVVKAQIAKIQTINGQKTALAKVVQRLKAEGKNRKKAPVRVGDVITTKIEKTGPRGAGFAMVKNRYGLVIPNAPAVGTEVEVQVTKVKSTYAFAVQIGGKQRSNNPALVSTGAEGTRFTVRLPRKAKRYGRYVVVRMQPSNQVLFVRLEKRARLGDVVRLQIERSFAKFSIASIVSVAPMPQSKKSTRMRQNLRAMVQSGIHWGEKAVRCHARMRKYVWLQRSGRPLIKKGRHVLNLLRTRLCLSRTLRQLGQFAAKGRPFLFVGTKKSAAGLVARAAFLTNTSFYVNTRWLGGMLTNWRTILKSISKIQPILQAKRNWINRVLKKRRMIKQLLLQRVQTFKPQTTVVRRLVEQANALLQRMRQPDHPRFSRTAAGWKAGLTLLRRIQPLARTRRELRQMQSEATNRVMTLTSQARQLRRTYMQVVNQLNIQTQSFQQFAAFLRISQGLDRVIEKSPALALQVAPPKALVQRAMALKTMLDASELPGDRTLAQFVRTLHLLGPYAENGLKQSKEQLVALENYAQLLKQNLMAVNAQLQKTTAQWQVVQKALGPVEHALVAERARFKPWKAAYRRWAAEKRFWEFLPKMKQVCLSQVQMNDAAQAVMRKLVDPKLKERVAQYDVYAEKLKNNSKKVAAARKKQWQRLETYLGGVTRMTKLRADQLSQMVAIIVGQSHEMNAVRECQKMGITTVQLVDTDGNPTLADHFVPMNDDSRQAIRYVLEQMIERIRMAHTLRRAMARARNKKAGMKRMSQKGSTQSGLKGRLSQEQRPRFQKR